MKLSPFIKNIIMEISQFQNLVLNSENYAQLSSRKGNNIDADNACFYDNNNQANNSSRNR